ncbi:hypothetical protein MASR1M101_31900 [Gemmatimonas sp.]
MTRSDTRTGLALLAAFSVLFVPTLHAWTLPGFRVGALEFDPWLGLVGSPFPGRIVHTVGFLVAGLAYARLSSSAQVPSARLVVAGLVVAFAAVPWISPDVMFYLAKGWAQVEWDMSAYRTSIGQVPDFAADPVFGSMVPGLANLKGNYGPLFQELSTLIASISGGNPQVGLLVFKVVMTGAMMVCCLQVRDLQRSCGRAERPWSMELMLLNPLLIANFVVAAHNDVVLMVLVLAGLQLALRSRYLLSGIFLGLSISIKLIGVFLLPVLGLYILRNLKMSRAVKAAAMGIVGVLLGGLVGVLPDLGSTGYFESIVQYEAQIFRSSIYLLLDPVVRDQGFEVSAMVLGKVAFVVVAGFVLYRNYRVYWPQPNQFLLRSAFEVLLLMQLLVLPSMNEWYLAWTLLLAFALPDDAAAGWIRSVSVLYMPLVVWAIVGDPIVTGSAQLLILVVLLLTTAVYFLDVRRIGSVAEAAV